MVQVFLPVADSFVLVYRRKCGTERKIQRAWQWCVFMNVAGSAQPSLAHNSTMGDAKLVDWRNLTLC